MAARSFLWAITDADKQDKIMHVIRQALKVPNTTMHIPVENPISLDRSNLQLLQTDEYMVAFKADGVRYLLVLMMYRERPLAALVDRAKRMFALHVQAPASHFINTSVFDGELCECSTGNNTYDFLMFNALIDQGAYLGEQPFPIRLNHLHSNFSGEAIKAKDRVKITSFISPVEPRLNFIRKECDAACNMRAMHRNIIPRYKYDGFVFTPCTGHVVPGRNERLLKWKSTNTIDVQLRVHDEDTATLWVDNNGQECTLESVVQTPVLFALTPKLQQLILGFTVYHRLFLTGRPCFNHTIEADCWYKSGGELVLNFLRLRPDKDGPNNTVTIHRTLQTIQDNISQEELYTAVLRQ